MSTPVRVLLADESHAARARLRAIIGTTTGIEVVGEAGNAREAVRLARELKPSVLSLALETPVTRTLEVIDEIMTTKAVPILVLSPQPAPADADEVFRCGALDMIVMPNGNPQAASDYIAKLKMLAGVAVVTRIRARPQPAEAVAVPAAAPTSPVTATPRLYRRVVAIASSTGGPQALAQILSGLPADFPAPILVAQHISNGFAQGMVDWLGGLCKLPVRLGSHGESLQAGTIYISPSEQHMSVTRGATLALLPCGDKDLYHPNCDILLESVATTFGGAAIGVILTGMGHDGVEGLEAIRRAGGTTLAQDEASSVVFGMNGVAVKRGAAQRVMPLAGIAGALCLTVMNSAGAST